MNEDFLKSLPSLDICNNRFCFIKNELIRNNCAIYLQYVALLLAMSEDGKIGNYKYPLYKDIIVYAASIIEAVLEYSVDEYIVKGLADVSYFGYSTNYSRLGKVNHECAELADCELLVVKLDKTPKLRSRDLSFDDINTAAKKAKIIEEAEYKYADDLRRKRNRIHISSLEKNTNDYFSKKDVEEIFENAQTILKKVETKLLALQA